MTKKTTKATAEKVVTTSPKTPKTSNRKTTKKVQPSPGKAESKVDSKAAAQSSTETTDALSVAGVQKPSDVAVQLDKPQREKSSGKGLSWLALLISLVALGAGGYAAYQTTLSGQLTSGKVTGIDERVALVSTDQTNLKTSVSEVEARLKQVDQFMTDGFKKADADMASNEKAIAAVKASSDAMLTNLKGDLTEKIGGWKLYEVRSLLTMVGQRLRWTNDVGGAIRGLSNADQSIAQMNDASLDTVRAELAKEVSVLRSIKPVDITRIHNQLGMLAKEVSQLPLMQDALVTEAAAQASARAASGVAVASEPASGKETDDSGDWLSAGKSLMSGLSKMVKVENIDQTPAPALDEQAQFVVNTTLRLRMQEAQIALLKGHSEAYQLALKEAMQWARDHYDVDASKMVSWLGEVQGLSGVSTDLDIPDVSGSLIALDKAIQARS